MNEGKHVQQVTEQKTIVGNGDPRRGLQGQGGGQGMADSAIG